MPKEKIIKQEEMVSVPKKDLENVLQEITKLKENQTRLEGAVDKSQLARYDALMGGNKPLIRKVALSTWGQNGKIVTHWKMTANESFVDLKGVHEIQLIDVTLEDGEILKQVTLVDFYRMINKGVKGEIIGSKNEDGKEYLKIELDGGRQIEIEIPFVN